MSAPTPVVVGHHGGGYHPWRYATAIAFGFLLCMVLSGYSGKFRDFTGKTWTHFFGEPEKAKGVEKELLEKIQWSASNKKLVTFPKLEDGAMWVIEHKGVAPRFVHTNTPIDHPDCAIKELTDGSLQYAFSKEIEGPVIVHIEKDRVATKGHEIKPK